MSKEDLKLTAPLDINQLKEILPHRYPFLLVDKIIEITDELVVGEKCVTFNEWFFAGHFPQQPVMPGVLILEALAQTGAAAVHSRAENIGRLVFLAAVDGARFRQVVSPGDVLRLEMRQIMRRRGVGKSEGKAYVNGKLVCEAMFTFMSQPDNSAKPAK